MPFVDRADAGRRLANRLRYLRGEGPVVVGLPRGGVPVALNVALGLEAPLDVILVRKLGLPFRSELAMGAIDEVVACLELAAGYAVAPPTAGTGPARDEDVDIPAPPIRLSGHLTVPAGAAGVVLFAHGSGSSRHSPRNRYVAEVLNGAGLGTLLFDLLTPAEERTRANVFDVGLLAQRLTQATRWLRGQPGLEDVAVGYFGASTGAAAALWAAAGQPDIAAVVSRGGRPDLAGPRLGAVQAPTLLIVGGLDGTVLELNRRAQAQMRSESRVAVVPGATHLFEEPGTLAAAAALARDWCSTHLGSTTRSAA